MALVKVASLAALPPGSLAEVTVGETPYAVCNVDGEIRAVSGVCPHRNGPLGHGALHGGAIVCPWHAWEFDSATGEHDYNPAIRLECYPVTVAGDDVFLEIP